MKDEFRPDMDFCTLSHPQIDVIREISNIGMGHAATALSQLLCSTVSLKVPTVHRLDLSQVHDFFGGPELVVAGISMSMSGDARGILMLVFPEENARQLIEFMTGRLLVNTNRLDLLESSTLAEIGNILGAAYLNAICALLDITIFPSVPHLSIDMAGAVLDPILSRQCSQGDTTLLVEAEFHDSCTGVNGRFFLMPDPESIALILKATGMCNA